TLRSLHSLKANRALIPANRRPRTANKSRRTSQDVRPCLEWLEDRCLLSVVTNTLDSGPGSLRQAILDANSSPGTQTTTFAIPADDSQHYYYKDNGGPGVSLKDAGGASLIGVTTVDDTGMTPAQVQAAIPDIEPDYLHTWWSIQLTSTEGASPDGWQG